ncbi:ATP-binding protein [Paraliobacillus ryukyuensis]|uniref:ATP-binding protein n=1 Tax=Paraliobacillus ryukyuensis TaxID=200904 RepID=UPI0009A6E41F|nr:ATP-binding protein [Paraliobacillus ryukyuensis]
MQSLKAIAKANKFFAPEQTVLEEYICEGCSEIVKKTEFVIPIGPRKGETYIGNVGCKCEDYRLAKETDELMDRKRLKVMMEHFDSHSLLNKSLVNATFEIYEPTNDQQQNAKRTAMDYVADFTGTGNLLFSGTYGTGKSHLSVAITKALMEKGKTCVFISFPKLLTKIKDTYNNDGPTEDQLMNAMKNVDLLVIDDIGAEKRSEWSIAKLFEIIDDRAGKATIYTTNLNSEELNNWVGERNFSRIMENTQPIKLNGNDYRRKQF